MDDTDMATTDDASSSPSSIAESMTLANFAMIGACVAYTIYSVYYFGYVWLMTKFQYEFTGWGVGGALPIPGKFIDQTFNEYWIALFFLLINLFPPLCGLWVMLSPRSLVRFDIHRLCIFAAAVANIGILLYLFFWVWIFQNGSSFYPFSIANSAEYCCKHYGSVASSGKCSNTVDCLDLPTTSTIRLSTDGIFVAHLYSLLVYIALLIAGQLLPNVLYRNYVTAAMQTSDADSALDAPPTSPAAGKSTTRINIINGVYVVLVCAMLAFGVLLLDVRYTHEYPPEGPVGLRSARKGIEVVGMTMMIGVTILMPVAVLLAMFGARGRPWVLVIAFVVMIIFSGIHMFGLLTMMYSRGISNRPGYPNSLANHPLRCCATDTRSDPASECGNGAGAPGTCVLPATAFTGFTDPLLTSNQIPNNPWHTVILVFSIVLFVMDAVLIGVVFSAYLAKAFNGAILKTTGVQTQKLTELINSYVAPSLLVRATGGANNIGVGWPRPPTSNGSSGRPTLRMPSLKKQ